MVTTHGSKIRVELPTSNENLIISTRSHINQPGPNGIKTRAAGGKENEGLSGKILGLQIPKSTSGLKHQVEESTNVADSRKLRESRVLRKHILNR